MKLKYTALAVVFVLIGFSRAWAWSSTTFAYGYFTTHEYLNEKAYEELEKHPAFKKSKFPSLPDIQANSGVTSSQTGLGPDATINSYCSFHWYNPRTKQGNAPFAAQEYFNRLITTLQGNTPEARMDINGIDFEDEHLSAAHSAAYAAHYVQDMTCSFHVIGMPGAMVQSDRVASSKVNGPFRTYTLPEWQAIVKKYQEAAATSLEDNDTNLSDWFDATYWDGPWFQGGKRSSHFLYEGLVEIAYKNAASADWTVARKHEGFRSKLWLTNGSPDNRITGFSQRIASQTRDLLESNANGARIDTVKFQKDLEIGLKTATDGVASQVFDVVGKYIKIPYDDWWRAIQATYSVWRSAFSALDVEEGDIEFLRVPRAQDEYRLKAMLRNLDKEDASNVEASFTLMGDFSASGKIDAGTIAGEDVAYKGSVSTFHFKPKDMKQGKLVMRITGSYRDTPDSGLSIRVFDARRIKVIEFTMPKLTKMPREQAEQIAKAEPYLFKVTVESAGDAPKKEQAGLVIGQVPDPGTLVAEAEPVVLKAYGNFMAEVPDVVGMTEKKAMEAIVTAGLKPAPAKFDVQYDKPEGIVMEQNPGKGAKRAPGSEVTISIGRRLPPPIKPDAPVQQQAPQAAPGTTQQPGPEPEPPLRELQVSPGGATIEVGQSVALTAIPIALFPEKPVTDRVITGMSFQWIANLPGMASVAGNGRSASVTGLKAGVVNIMCITEQAMGLATITIIDKKTNDAGVSDAGGFKDSSDDWKTQDKDSGSNVVPDAPPPPPQDLQTGDSSIDQFLGVQPPPPPPVQDAPVNPPAYDSDPASQQQQMYEEQQRQQQQMYEDQQRRQQQMYEDQQRQQQILNMFGNMMGMLSNQAQQMQNQDNGYNNYPPPSGGGLNIPPAPGNQLDYLPVYPHARVEAGANNPQPANPPVISEPPKQPRRVRQPLPVGSSLDLLGNVQSTPVHTGSYGNCPKCGATLMDGNSCMCGWKK